MSSRLTQNAIFATSGLIPEMSFVDLCVGLLITSRCNIVFGLIGCPSLSYRWICWIDQVLYALLGAFLIFRTKQCEKIKNITFIRSFFVFFQILCFFKFLAHVRSYIIKLLKK